MKIRSILFVIGVAFSQLLLAQQTLPRDPDCCTSIMVGVPDDFGTIAFIFF